MAWETTNNDINICSISFESICAAFQEQIWSPILFYMSQQHLWKSLAHSILKPAFLKPNHTRPQKIMKLNYGLLNFDSKVLLDINYIIVLKIATNAFDRKRFLLIMFWGGFYVNKYWNSEELKENIWISFSFF